MNLMEKEFRREQHYAVSQKGVLSHIKEAHYNSEEYYCPHCGCRMLKRCGKIRDMPMKHKRIALMRHIYMDMQNYD